MSDALFPERAYSYALWLLSRRNYSARKLKAKLRSKRYSEEIATTAVQELIETGLLKELPYIEEKIYLWRMRGYSTRLIQQRLKHEGLLDLAAQSGLLEESDEDEQIEGLVAAEFRKIKNKTEDKKRVKEKVLRVLLRKGHSLHKVLPVVNRHFQDH